MRVLHTHFKYIFTVCLSPYLRSEWVCTHMNELTLPFIFLIKCRLHYGENVFLSHPCLLFVTPNLCQGLTPVETQTGLAELDLL